MRKGIFQPLYSIPSPHRVWGKTSLRCSKSVQALEINVRDRMSFVFSLRASLIAAIHGRGLGCRGFDNGALWVEDRGS